MRIFISYSHKNQDSTVELAADLDALGYEVWMDRELTGGRDWWQDILSNIRRCDVFILALTPEVLTSKPCKREYTYANSLHKSILPVLLAGVDVPTLPPVLQKIQYSDYRRFSKPQQAALNKALQRLPPPRPLPDPLPREPKLGEAEKAVLSPQQLSRKRFIDTFGDIMKQPPTPTQYAIIIDEMRRGLWGRSTRTLRKEMSLRNTADFRDHQSEIALMYEMLVESLCVYQFEQVSKASFAEVKLIVRLTAQSVGKQVKEMGSILSIDIATARSAQHSPSAKSDLV